MEDTQSYSDLSRSLRTSTDQSRRNSYAGGTPANPSTNSSNNGANDRTRHWMTIMGNTSSQGNSSSQTQGSTNFSRVDSDSRHSFASSLPYSRVNMLPNSRINSSSSENIQNDHPTRSLRKPIKPFQCDKCTRRFERRGHLKSHVDAVHELQQPYVCHIINCHRTFSHQSSLNRHLRRVHLINPTSERRSAQIYDLPDLQR